MPGRVSSGRTTSAPHPAMYTVTLRNTATGPTEAAQGLSLLARDIGKRAPGEDMNVSTLQLLYDAGAVADASLAGEPVGCPIAQRTLALASGCPPGRAVSFDIAASRFITRNSEELLVDHGCSNDENEHEREAAHALHSRQEDVIPCVWARHDFYPVFRLHDNLTGHSGTYNGSFRAQHMLLLPHLPTSRSALAQALRSSAVGLRRMQLWVTRSSNSRRIPCGRLHWTSNMQAPSTDFLRRASSTGRRSLGSVGFARLARHALMCYRPSPGRRSSFSVSASTLSTARALTAPTRLNSRSDCMVFRCPGLPSIPSSSVRCTQFIALPAGVQRKRRCSQGLRLSAAPSCFCPTLCACSALLPGYRTRELNLLILNHLTIGPSEPVIPRNQFLNVLTTGSAVSTSMPKTRT